MMNRTKERKLSPVGAGAALALLLALVPGLLLAAGGDIYRSDFSTRTSALPLPGDRWMSYDYDPNTQLYINYSGGGSTYNMWESNHLYQDAWGKPWMDNATATNSPGFALATDPVHGSPDNYLAFFRSSSSRTGCAIQPLHNEFTNGMLRLEVDIRRPAVWGSQIEETHAARVALIYRKRMADPLWWVGINSTDYPVMFGARWEGGSNKNRLVLHYRNGSGQQTSLEPGVYGDDYECTENWYRWRVYVNLDEQRSNCYIWDVGPDQPTGRNTLADDTATRKVESTTYFFRNPMTAETGGISGIALNSYRCLSGTEANLAVTNAPCFDNIHIAWKAPGSSEYVPFYENDFSTRRYRRIQPTPTATVAYPVDTAISTEDNFTSYVVMTNREEASPTLLVNTSLTDVPGVDNWIRLQTGSKFCVIDSKTNGKNELRVSDGGSGVIAQTLGETITSGKVRISGDVRLPTEWNLPSGQNDARVCLALGSPDYWSLTDPGNFTGRHIGYGAIVGESTNEFCAAYLPPGSATLISAKDTSVACTPKTWYRMVVTADLDAKTYDYELYEIGTYAGAIDRTDVPSTPVYATNAIPFRSNVSSIGSFGLYSYRSGSNWNNYILWDNLQVWKDWDSSAGTGTLVYANDFNKRTRYLSRNKTELVHGVNTGVGVDCWEQVNRRDGIVWIVGGANRFLSLKAPNAASLYMTQPLPFEVPCGQRVAFRVDVRPPRWWVQESGNLNIYLGGDWMGQHATAQNERLPFNDSVMMFGLYPDAASLGRYTNCLFRVQSGNTFPTIKYGDMKTDHWYRLEGTTLSGSDSWKFRAYDMGATHPEIDAPAGPLVAARDGLARRSSGATSGISSICISTGGMSSLDPWDLYDRGRVLVDNLVVSVIPAGACIIVR